MPGTCNLIPLHCPLPGTLYCRPASQALVSEGSAVAHLDQPCPWAVSSSILRSYCDPEAALYSALTPKAQGADVIPFIVSVRWHWVLVMSLFPPLGFKCHKGGTCLNIPLPITQLNTLGRFSVSTCLMI